MTDDKRLLWANPTPSAMKQLTATAELFKHLDALGVETSDLLPDSPLGLDLRPRSFQAAGARATRESTGCYLLWTRRVIEDCISDPQFGYSRLVTADLDAKNPDQQAGDRLVREAALGSGPDANALARWLQLWGWTPPPPMVA